MLEMLRNADLVDVSSCASVRFVVRSEWSTQCSWLIWLECEERKAKLL